MIADDLDQAVAWKTRLTVALIERQFPDDVLLEMLRAGLNQAHAEGLEDAASVCDRVAQAVTNGTQARTAEVLAKQLRALIKMNSEPLRPTEIARAGDTGSRLPPADSEMSAT